MADVGLAEAMQELVKLRGEVSALRTAGDRMHHWLGKAFSEGHPWRLRIESVMQEWQALRTGGGGEVARSESHRIEPNNGGEG